MCVHRILFPQATLEQTGGHVMKKRNRKNLVRLMVILTIMSFFMFGCSKTEVATDTNTEKEDIVVEAPETTAEVEEPQEEAVEVIEPKVEEEPEEETYNGMPIAKAETTVSDIYEFLDYAESFAEPALLIYNESEGYVIKMEEGEYYQLKANDRIFEYLSEKEKASSDTLEAGGGTNIAKDANVSYVYEMKPDYSQYDSPHEVLFVVYFTEEREKGDYFLLTCYLDAPTE